MSDHVLAARHQALVNHLRCIVTPGVDVDALLDNRVGSCAEGLADLVSAGLDLWAGLPFHDAQVAHRFNHPKGLRMPSGGKDVLEDKRETLLVKVRAKGDRENRSIGSCTVRRGREERFGLVVTETGTAPQKVRIVRTSANGFKLVLNSTLIFLLVNLV